jgi:catechol 2,3-dioxygenase-like lactoylglutathione lyase family enzyme
MKLPVNHVGLTVADVERSTAFYTSLGGEVVHGGKFGDAGTARALGLPELDLETRFIRFEGLVLELLQYRVPESRPYTARNCDAGAAHVAFTVEDLPGLYETLRARGVEFSSEPVPIPDGDYAGGFFVYARDPDGVSVEFLQPGAGPA